jgi:uncharacterized protein YggE
MAIHPSCRCSAPAPGLPGCCKASRRRNRGTGLPAAESAGISAGSPSAAGRWGAGVWRAGPLALLGRAQALPAALLLPMLAPALARAEGQVQLSCAGTLLEASGQAELERRTTRLQISISLEAQGVTADQALGQLQSRLAAVRSSLQGLAVAKLQVSSPSSWQRPAEAGRAALVQATLQVSGLLAPERLQSLIRTVGALPGVQLAPVATLADPAEDGRVRQLLLQGAWQDALRQARPLALLLKRPRLTPLEVRLEAQERAPMPVRAMAAESVPPFRPEELTKPKDRLALQVRFCAQ